MNNLTQLSKLLCLSTAILHKDRIKHFAQRIAERRETSEEVMIVVINVNSPGGEQFAELVDPGKKSEWVSIRRNGGIPFSRGLAIRSGIQAALKDLNELDAATKLEKLEGIAIMVWDHGTVEVLGLPDIEELPEAN